jgi:YfiH family protein
MFTNVLMQLYNDPLPYYTSALLPVPHGMFCCGGGSSTKPFAPLNLSYSVGDQADRVGDNRARALAALQLSQLISVKQTHSDQVLGIEQPHIATEMVGYDAMISTLPGTGLLIQQADCQAILLFAPQQGVIAAIHSGWRGSVLDIIGKTIRRLQEHYGVAPDSLLAVISPSLGPCCAEFINYHKELPTWMHLFQVRPLFFDFWAISRHQLLRAGLRQEHIEIASICTCCNQQFFSYRRATKAGNGVTGRNGSIIGLPEQRTGLG